MSAFSGDVEFCLSFVEIIRLFDFATWIEDKIYEKWMNLLISLIYCCKLIDFSIQSGKW